MAGSWLCTGTTDNLYKSRVFEYMNVSPFSHIGMLRRNLPPPELEKRLFWHSLDAHNWDSVMVLYEQLTIPEARESACEALIVQVDTAAQTVFNDYVKALAQRRLEQARVLVKPEETNRRVLETLKSLPRLSKQRRSEGRMRRCDASGSQGSERSCTFTMRIRTRGTRLTMPRRSQ